MPVDPDVSALLNVRDTAKLLDVHENTVRNWVKSGLLPDSRVPGSRFHRFRRSDVERLRDQRGEAALSLQDERQTIGPELVDASQLDRWADTRAAQETFPELMRRLLAATPGVSGIQIRAGDGVALPGWDGSAESEGTSYLPKGTLKFEFGVNKQIRRKADQDWSARARSGPSSDVFIFASPRRWSQAASWADQKRAEKQFSDVHVLDADSLEGWLQATPSVHYWISERLGRRPREARTIEAWWSQFSASTQPELPAGLFLTGRETHADRLGQILNGPAQATSLQAEWANDARGFIYAASRQHRPQYGLPVVLVDSPEVFARLAEQPGRVVLVPTYQDVDVAKAINNGHHVILIMDESQASNRRPDIALPRPPRRQTAEAFQAQGLEFHTAQQYAAHARRNLQAFVRSISKNPLFARPAWARPPVAESMARLMLVGGWTTSAPDLARLEAFVGRSTAEINNLLAEISSSDPAFRKVGSQWTLTSPREAFDLLAPRLVESSTMRQDWIEAVTQTLSEPDPVLDLPESERPYAGLRQVHRAMSSKIRQGMARGAVMLGALGEDFELEDGTTLAHLPAVLVQELLAAANEDASGRKWRELGDVLPLLAEAAPQQFLDAVQQDLMQPSPVLLQMFADSGESELPLFGGTSPHTYLLWALETVCWSSDHFPEGVRALARLASIDPGGKTTNRPASSLATVLCGWVHNTAAPSDVRIQALRNIKDAHPDVCWNLTIALWPSNHGISFPPHHPYMQRWVPSSSEVLLSDWATYTHGVVDIALDLVHESPVRIGKLVEGLGLVPEEDRDRIIHELQRIVSDVNLDSGSRFALWEQLKKILGRHERFSQAEWAFRPEILARIKTAIDGLEPTDDPKRFARLFDWHPDLPGIDEGEYQAHGAELMRLQTEALESIMSSPDALLHLRELASHAPVPGHLGFAAAKIPSVPLEAMVEWLSGDTPALREAAGAWVSRRAQESDRGPFVESSLNSEFMVGNARQLFLRSIPLAPETWAVIERRPEDADYYWENVYPRVVRHDEVAEVVARLTSHGRAWAATSVLAHLVHEHLSDPSKPEGPTVELVIRTLNSAIAEDPRPSDVSNMTSYYIGQLMDYLEKDGHVDVGTMARFEFAFFRLLEHTRTPTVLTSALATQPDLFVDLAKRVYRGKNEKEIQSEGRNAELANQAWWVLKGWNGFPGQSTTGGVDEAVLIEWVKTARLLFSESDRSDIGDELIGQTFANAPAGSDGVWPPEPVRDLVELIGSSDLENGIIIGKLNSRGLTTRDPYEGGTQERALSNQFRDWSNTVKAKWPRTARILRSLAEDYGRHARREDIRAEIQADAD